jgi:hypothetical protein
MPTLPERTDTRRLNFKKPDPAPSRTADQQDRAAAIAKRKTKKERHRLPPFQRHRLPHGAVFHVEYSAECAEWRGSLTIGVISVEGRSGGVMALLAILDEKYRAIPEAPAGCAVEGCPDCIAEKAGI